MATKQNKTKNSDQPVENPVMSSEQIAEAKDKRLMVSALVLSGLYANPANGNKWYKSFGAWLLSRIGLKADTVSTVGNCSQLAKVAMDAANELVQLNETTPL